jgi:hypothetical protein
MADHPLSQRIADVLGLQPDARAIEYDGRWLSWGEVGEAAWRTASLTAEHSADPQIGMLLRNRPGQVAAFLGVLLGGHWRTRRSGDAGPSGNADSRDVGSFKRCRRPFATRWRTRSAARGRDTNAHQRNHRSSETN